MNTRAQHILSFLFGSLLTYATFISPLQANPQQGTVVAGNASISQPDAKTVLIQQNSDSAIIDWKSFSIGADEHTRFQQPGSSSIILNRVTGGDVSKIFGQLSANGKVMLVNPAGIYMSATARINVASLIATTGTISNEDFLAGNYKFIQTPGTATSVINEGEIRAAEGLVALVAPAVANNGLIEANIGQVVLASGNEFTVDLYGDQIINFAVNNKVTQAALDQENKPVQDAVANRGTIIADGGKIVMTANVAQNVVQNVINMEGVAQARSVVQRNGEIILTGGETGVVKVTGRLDASGKTAGRKGGTVKVLGQHVKLNKAVVDVSGDEGGGTVLIGGNFQGKGPEMNATTTFVDADSIIEASAVSAGDGGKIIIWANEHTDYAGHIMAKGGSSSGNGGFAEVSGKEYLSFQGNVNLAAANGNMGQLLLDPRNLILNYNTTTATASGAPTNSYTSNVDDSVLYIPTLANALSNANVTLQTGSSGSQAGNIVIQDAVSWDSSNTLTLMAHNDIVFDGPNASLLTSNGNIILRADADGNGFGTVTGTGGLSAAGFIKIYYNPSSYNSPAPFSSGGTATLTAYMLVNTAAQLASIGGGGADLWDKNYALGKDIDMSGQFYTSIGDIENNYTGKFDGNKYKISNLSVVGGQEVGMFRRIGSAGEVRNLGLINVDVTGNGWVGGLAGLNFGTIDNVYVTGTVNGPFQTGGLVGNNGGTGAISNTYSSATVNGTASNYIGGLVGLNSGTITTSYSTGRVNPTNTSSNVGGLVGDTFNGGTVTNSYWDTDTSGHTTSDGGTGRTTAQMMQQSNFSGFSFYDPVSNPTGVWLMAGNPHLIIENTSTITNAVELQLMAANLSGNYTLANDIDASATSSWNGGAGFMPIGTSTNPFTGSLNGNFYDISQLKISRLGQANTGLFGYTSTGSVIQKVGITGGDVAGGAATGGLVGRNNGGAISNSFYSGTVTGNADGVAGLVGYNTGSITTSYTTGSVTNTGVNSTAGLVGDNFGSITNSYSMASVSGVSNVGGLVGIHYIGAQITSSYSTGAVSGDFQVGGLIGLRIGSASIGSNVYWDTTTSGTLTGVGNTSAFNAQGRLSSQMMQQSTFQPGSNDWSFYTSSSTSNPWIMAGYPHLIMENRSTITNVVQLQLIAANLLGNYTLANDIDASDTVNWNGEQGFAPLAFFGGTINGNNHTISDLIIKRPTEDYVGLVGIFEANGVVAPDTPVVENLRITGSITGGISVGAFVGYGQRGIIRNVINEASVTGSNTVGGIVGYGAGIIEKAINLGKVVNSGAYTGGITGYAENYISDSYNLAPVIGNEWVGGIAGGVGDFGALFNTFNAGYVQGNNNVGGITGLVYGNVGTSNFWDTETSGQLSSAGLAVARNTTQMMDQNTFTAAGWDFTTVWNIAPNSYPYLRAHYTGTPQIVSGKVYTSNATSPTPIGGDIQIGLGMAGYQIANTYTGKNGFYYFFLEDAPIAAQASIITYINEGSTLGNAVALFADGSTSYITNNHIYGDTLAIRNYSSLANFQNSDAISVSAGVPSYSSQLINYTVSGNNLSITGAGQAFQVESGTNYLLTGDINTNGGNIIIKGGLVLGGADGTRTLSAGSGSITLNQVSEADATSHSLIANASGGITLYDNISVHNNLQFTGATTLAADVTLTSQTGNISFANNITGANRDLTLVAANGDISLAQIGADGNALDTFTVTSANNLTLNDAIYANTVTGNASRVNINNVNINLNNIINNVIATGGTANLAAGDYAQYVNLTKTVNLTSSGAVNFNGFTNSVDVGLSGSFTANIFNLQAPVTLVGDTTLNTNSNDLTINNAITGNYALTLTSQANITINTALGNSGSRLASLTTNGTTILNADSYYTSGNQNYNGAVTLGGNVRFDSSNGNITFNNTLMGSHDLTLSAPSGDITFVGAAGSSSNRLGALVIENARNVTELDVLKVFSFTQHSGSGTTAFGAADVDATQDVIVNTGYISGAIFAGGSALLIVSNGMNAYVNVNTLTVGGTNSNVVGYLTGYVGGVTGTAAALKAKLAPNSQGIFKMYGVQIGLMVPGVDIDSVLKVYTGTTSNGNKDSIEYPDNLGPQSIEDVAAGTDIQIDNDSALLLAARTICQ